MGTLAFRNGKWWAYIIGAICKYSDSGKLSQKHIFSVSILRSVNCGSRKVSSDDQTRFAGCRLYEGSICETARLGSGE